MVEEHAENTYKDSATIFLAALLFVTIALGLTYTGELSRWDRLFFNSLSSTFPGFFTNDIVIPSVYKADRLRPFKQAVPIEPLDMKLRFLLTAFFILLPFYYFPRLRPNRAIQVTLILLLSIVLLSAFLLFKARIWYTPVPALLLISVSYLLWTWRRLNTMVRRLDREKKQTDITLQSIHDAVITTSAAGEIQYMNSVAEKLTGYHLTEAKELALGQVLPIMFEQLDSDLAEIIGRCLMEKTIIEVKDTGIMVDCMGEEHAVKISVGPFHDKSGRPRGVVLGMSDVTETKQALRQIAYQATHDTLTGLPNRSMLLDRLQHAITQSRRSGYAIAVLFINLDSFKKVNDRLGHYGGNHLIEAVGSRLQSCCRDGDTVACLGGDEFVVLLENMQDSKVAAAVASKLIKFLELPYRIDRQELFVTSSIGISVFPKDGNDAETLLKNSSTAMYRSKQTGRNTFCFFSRQMDRVIHERLALEKKLRYALDNNEFELFYQPQIRLQDGKIAGVEALLRWYTPESGSIPPEKFIPVAEKCGLIFAIGQWVIEKAYTQALIWKNQSLPDIRMAVNISPGQFSHPETPNLLNKIAEKTRKNNINIELELTENMIMEDMNRAASILRNFKKYGGKVAIDDFGTGYSSLSYLKQLPIDTLKIESSFVHDIAIVSKDMALAGAIITMAHGLGLTVIAEGVETQAQVNVLKKLQCDIIQGHIFARPMSAQEITELMMSTPVLKHPVTSGLNNQSKATKILS